MKNSVIKEIIQSETSYVAFLTILNDVLFLFFNDEPQANDTNRNFESNNIGIFPTTDIFCNR